MVNRIGEFLIHAAFAAMLTLFILALATARPPENITPEMVAASPAVFEMVEVQEPQYGVLPSSEGFYVAVVGFETKTVCRRKVAP